MYLTLEDTTLLTHCFTYAVEMAGFKGGIHVFRGLGVFLSSSVKKRC